VEKRTKRNGRRTILGCAGLCAIGVAAFPWAGGAAVPKPLMSIDDPVVLERDRGAQALEYTITLSAPAGPAGASVRAISSLALSTASASPTPGFPASDYYPLPKTIITFAPGEQSKSVVVYIESDELAEPDETVAVKLSNSKGAKLAKKIGLGTIDDDD
jgi:hypothetical protein